MHLKSICVRAEYPELKRAVLAQAERWKPHAILIEDKASGQQLLQDLKREHTLPLLAVQPTTDKITRLAAVSALIEAGRVYLPRFAPWLSEFELEILAFPKGAHDDHADALSQYLGWLRRQNYFMPTIRKL